MYPTVALEETSAKVARPMVFASKAPIPVKWNYDHIEWEQVAAVFRAEPIHMYVFG